MYQENFDQLLLYSLNSCFRTEDFYDGLFRVKEFRKVEQFAFCNENNYKYYFDILLDNAINILNLINLPTKYRVIDKTKTDPGYHIKKYDIEVLTKKYGWMETHSCTYFRNEQIKRFDVGLKHIHTISNTGIASPRILIPFIESM